MKYLQFINELLSKYITLIILALSAVAFMLPDYFAWGVQYTAIFLGVAMFGMGLNIRPQDFAVVLARPKDILLGTLAQYTIMPFAAWAICSLFRLPPDIAVGVILVGCCPGGTASNVIAYIAKGDVALSVGMTTVSTLLAPFVTPLLIYGLMGTWIEVDISAMMISVTKIVLLPVLLGIAVQYLFRHQVERIRPVSPLISMIAIVMIIAAIIAVNRDKLISSGLLTLAVVCLHNLVGLGLGLVVGKWLGLNYAKTTSLAIEVGMQNSGLAVALAAINFAANPLATLPGAVFSVWHNMSGAVFAGIRRYYMVEAPENITSHYKQAAAD
ncbi:bile acid:sodium symporter family protein [Necropsobacter rosorum]|uniref:bile acid:sodium symporter family protein n=1 Tax=Necropsobacter rosorum TaxID=908285 RepID=UPI000509961A